MAGKPIGLSTRKPISDMQSLDRTNPDPLNLVGFHVQQAIEKALKALLVARQIEFPRTHDLARLLVLLKQAGIHYPAALERVKDLTPLACSSPISGL